MNQNPPSIPKAKVYDIYMDWNIGATGTQRHLTNQLKHYSKPILSTNAQNYVDEQSEYTNIFSIPLDSQLHSLRDNLETAVCVCIYNEDSEAIEQTLTGIYKNLDYLPSSNTPSMDQTLRKIERGREQLAVFIVQDGIMKCHPSVSQFLRPYEPVRFRSKLKTRQDIIKYETEAVRKKKREINPMGGQDFPWSVPRKVSLMYQIQWKPEGETSQKTLKVFFIFKHLNGKKLSSHAWFFEGFCRYLSPEFCVLLDVGTVPDKQGIANFVKALRSDINIGGVSGFMNIDADLVSEGVQNQQSQNCCKKMFWSLQKAQAYQYIMAHFLDKNFESSLGFLHVLPGAWSAYRIAALQTGEIFEQDILQKKYFRTIINPDEKLNAEEMMKTSNMYLAEDRILSLAIYCQRNRQYYLKYVPNARAKTDPMKTEADLSLQRRRWINSSVYAFEYVQANYQFDMSGSKHSQWDKFRMHFNIFMSSLNFFNSSLIPCFFLFILFSTIRYNSLIPNIQNDIIRILLAVVISVPYVIVVFAAIGGSMIGNIWVNDIYERDGNGDVKKQRVPGFKEQQPVKRSPLLPKASGYARYITNILTFYNYVWFLAVGTFTIQLAVTGISRWNTTGISFQAKHLEETFSILFLFVNTACYLLLLIVHLPTHAAEVWELMISFPSSLSYLSLYTHTMVIFSVCNVDDTSWGTKGSTDKEGGSDFSKEKSYYVGGWILKNAVLCFIFFMIDMNVPGGIRYITIILASYSSIYYAVKCIIAIINQVRFLFGFCCRCK